MDIGRYSDTIVRIVKGSEPNFALGVFGEWGTGKTTLMKHVEIKLKQQHDILTVWFNAWRYEREEQFAVIALLKTIAYEMDKHEIYKGMKKVLLRGAKIFGKDLLRQVASQRPWHRRI